MSLSITQVEWPKYLENPVFNFGEPGAAMDKK
jgi:hypothetical protein